MSKPQQISELLEDMLEAVETLRVDWSQVAKMLDDVTPLIEYMYEEWVEENFE